jgi:thymidylate kinase
MLEYIETLTPYILPTLTLTLNITVFIVNERRARRKDKAEREQLEAKQQENSAPLPPRRSKRHSR